MAVKSEHVQSTPEHDSSPDRAQVEKPQAFNEPSFDLASEAILKAMPPDPVGQAATLRRLQGETRERLMTQFQQSFGNRYVQRVMDRVHSTGQPEADVAQRIQAASSEGSALDTPLRNRLADGLGADMSDVRVHTDQEADHLSREVSAIAFTTGSHIFFRDGAYQPDTLGGLRLIAHEAAHTLQQANGPVAGTSTEQGVSISDPSDSFEQAAEHAADRVMGLSKAASHVSPASSPASDTQRVAVQREGEEELAAAAAMVSPLASTLAPAADLGMAATIPASAEAALSVGALPGTAAYSGMAGAIDAQAAADFVAAWGGPEALASAASQGLGTAAADVAGAGAVDTALASAATLPADAMAAMGSAATVPEIGALATLPESAMTGLATGALPGTAEYATLAGAIDSTAAADMVAAWGGPEALMAAAGGGGEAAALGGAEALALGGAEAAGAAGAGAAGGGLAAAALPAAAVVGAGLAGAAAGYGLDQLSNYVGQKVTGNEKGDYHISTGIGNALTAADQGLTSLWSDPSKPEYQQTLGWKLANWLTPTSNG